MHDGRIAPFRECTDGPALTLHLPGSTFRWAPGAARPIHQRLLLARECEFRKLSECGQRQDKLRDDGQLSGSFINWRSRPGAPLTTDGLQRMDLTSIPCVADR